MDEREPISLRWHRAMYPRHLIWRRAQIVRGRLKIKRLFDGIRWED